MTCNVIPFRDPSMPAVGADRLAARRIFRAHCRSIAARTVAQAFSEASKTPGTTKLGCDDALYVFVAAMRRELRKTGLF